MTNQKTPKGECRHGYEYEIECPVCIEQLYKPCPEQPTQEDINSQLNNTKPYERIKQLDAEPGFADSPADAPTSLSEASADAQDVARPREWTLHGADSGAKVNGLYNLIGPRLRDEVVDVIEKSAYDRVVRERDELTKINRMQHSALTRRLEENSKIYVELEKLKAERDEWREQCEETFKTMKALEAELAEAKQECDDAWDTCKRATDEIERLREALKK